MTNVPDKHLEPIQGVATLMVPFDFYTACKQLFSKSILECLKH